jgi:hypothetical protein
VPGDFNDDGNADSLDFLIWQRELGATRTVKDFDDWRADMAFMKSLNFPLGAPIPEPTRILLAFYALLTFAVCQRTASAGITASHRK